jgi:hypothetical protein
MNESIELADLLAERVEFGCMDVGLLDRFRDVASPRTPIPPLAVLVTYRRAVSNGRAFTCVVDLGFNRS